MSEQQGRSAETKVQPPMVDVEILEAALAMMPVASTDSMRQYLAGVHVMAMGDQTLLRATNGHIMVRRVLRSPFPFRGAFMIPRMETEKALRHMLKRNERPELPVVQVPGRGLLVGAEVTVLFEEYGATYPDLDATIPKLEGPKVAISLDAEYLLRLARALSYGESPRVRLTFDPTISGAPYLVEATADVYPGAVAVLMPVHDKQVKELAEKSREVFGATEVAAAGRS